MCGISGIIKKSNELVEFHEVDTMNTLVAHRGPDGSGVYVQGQIGLGHRRLSIIDLSNQGHQPMTIGNLTISYNGEVYNYIEIREELKLNGYTFTSQSDTEVILKAYQAWGMECVTRFNGMWSFAIYDSSKNIIFCSRDRFGIKPFYFLDNEEFFAFGSEIKQLLDFKDARKVNLTRVSNYLLYGESENDSNTFFKNIQKLPASHNLIFDLSSKTYRFNKYFDLTKKGEFSNYSLDEAKAKFLELLSSSISLRMRSDVRVGACLSGGLDSSTIVSLANQNNPPSNFTCINAKAVDPLVDESSYAKLVADFTKTNIETVSPTEQDFLENVERVIYIQEEPFSTTSPVFQYYVFKTAKEKGCIVMLDGQGGDENLLGYTYYGGPLLMRTSTFKVFSQIRNLSKNSGVSIGALLKQIGFAYFNKITSTNFYLKRKNKHLKTKVFSTRDDSYKHQRHDKFSGGSVFDWQKNEFYAGSIPALLRYEDKNSMASSIESRLPFLDYRFVEFCLSIPADLKVRDGWFKFLLRDAMKDKLPKEILWRKVKFGFNTPDKEWLKDRDNLIVEIKNSSLLDDLVNMGSLKEIDTINLWKLYNLAVWERLYKVEV